MIEEVAVNVIEPVVHAVAEPIVICELLSIDNIVVVPPNVPIPVPVSVIPANNSVVLDIPVIVAVYGDDSERLPIVPVIPEIVTDVEL